MRNADLDDLKDEQYAEQVRQERKEVDAMPKTQTTCPRTAAYRYTWPGRDESFICTEHVGKLKSVAAAIGCHLQVIPLDTPQDERPTCQQKQ